MSKIFRDFLKKIGSGPHTGQNLTRSESATATRMMLLGEATPAQIGAFMIAHRIKRPTADELAGMLDAYQDLGCHISTDELEKPLVVFGNPYDGRSRTLPLLHLTTLLLSAAGIPILLHGGDLMPTKYGIPLVQIWQQMGVDFTRFSLSDIQSSLAKVGIGFIYTPKHFPVSQQIISYRDEIGKRPPFATIELIWSPCQENTHIVVGYVHPPTEDNIQETFKLRGILQFTTVKGLEGSCDLSRSRTAIIGMVNQDQPFTRLCLNPWDYQLSGKDLSLESPQQLLDATEEVLAGKPTEMTKSLIWNGGFYLWRFGVCSDIHSALSLAESMITQGVLNKKLQELLVL